MKNGKKLAAGIVLYNHLQYKGGLPKTLNDLTATGVLKEIPQCECVDGKMRDFIYVTGWDQTISGYAVLASPPEMDSKVTIVVYMDLSAKVLSRQEAEGEIEKSRAFAASIRKMEEEATPKATSSSNTLNR
jgi:phosphoserine aminotransferase